ncbi:MAG: septum formation initiator family protein [Clostridiales bacterium]|jgi:cell division protein FtsB|nr:septum formation initiator family protein [Clostridiales bacterium]
MYRQVEPTKGVKRTTKALILFLIVLVVLFITVWFYQFSKYAGITAVRDELQQKIDKELRIKANLEKEKTYQNTDAFIEDIARRELNMIKQNELIIINESE